MIWKSNHVATATDLYARMQQQHRSTSSGTAYPTLTIVGGGPKGLYALNHLLNQIHISGTTQPIHVLWFNADELFGCGPNYNVHQPDYLLINYCIGHIQAFHPDYRHMENQKSFIEWLTEVKTIDSPVAPTDFASRALVGRYLQWVAAETISRLPEHVTLECIPQQVVGIQPEKSSMAVQTMTGLWETHSILLATGHCYTNDPLLSGSQQIPSTAYKRYAYPVSQFETISAQDHVGIAGLGLTFIDVVLALTEGRGGVFADGVYQPSGREPIIYPFSRTGLPICCRGPQYQREGVILHIMDADWFQTLKNKNRKIDFTAEILPFLEEEIQIAFYSVLWNMKNTQQIQEKIARIPAAKRFTLQQLLRPQIETDEELLDYIQTGIREAQRGQESSALMAAAAVWGNVSLYLADLYHAGGFTGESQKRLDQYYFGAFNRVSYGPPIVNMEKIAALAQAGIIRFDMARNPLITWNSTEQKFVFKNDTGQKIQIGVLIDARIARPSLQKKNAAIYTNLLQHGWIEPYENQDYRPGTLALDKNGKCISVSPIPIYCYGSNTEGAFFDNDTLSRTKNDTARYWVQDTLMQIS